MRSFAVLALVAALSTFAFVPSAEAAGCIVGNDAEACTVSVQVIYCFTEPCDGTIVCVDHGAICSNRILP